MRPSAERGILILACLRNAGLGNAGSYFAVFRMTRLGVSQGQAHGDFGRSASIISSSSESPLVSIGSDKDTTRSHVVPRWLRRLYPALVLFNMVGTALMGTQVVNPGLASIFGGLIVAWAGGYLASYNFVFRLSVQHRAHCLAVTCDFSRTDDMRRLVRKTWTVLTGAEVLCSAIAVLFFMADGWNLGTPHGEVSNVLLFAAIMMIITMPTIVAGLFSIVLLASGHSSGILSLQRHAIRHVYALHPEPHDGGSQVRRQQSTEEVREGTVLDEFVGLQEQGPLPRELRQLVVADAQRMSRTKSLLGFMIYLCLAGGLGLGYVFLYFAFKISTSAGAEADVFTTLGVCLCFALVLLSFWSMIVLLQCLATVGDQYKELVFKLHKLRLKCAGPSVTGSASMAEADALLHYLQDGGEGGGREVMSNHCFCLFGYPLTSDTVSLASGGLVATLLLQFSGKIFGL